jgi:hypothetical protein
MKRSIAKKVVRFITQNGGVSFSGDTYLTAEEAAAFFVEFDKRLAAVEAKTVSSSKV